MHKWASVHHTWDLSIFWQRSWGLGCFSWHLKSIWQCLVRQYNFPINLKRNIREFTQGDLLYDAWLNEDLLLHVYSFTQIYSSLSERKQHVDSIAGAPQGFTLGSLLFLIYVNDLSEGPSTNTKLFADDEPLFPVILMTARLLQITLTRIWKWYITGLFNWIFQWKMNFNPNPTKQAQEVIFSLKTKNYLILP